MLPREKIMNYKIPMTMRSMLIFRDVKIQKIVLRSIKHSNLSVKQIKDLENHMLNHYRG